MVLPELPGPPAALDWSDTMAGRTSRSQVVVLRSIRYGEADRILHLYSAEHGRIGAIAKGVRKTKSRFGARLEPLSHVELMLHHGAGRAAHDHRRRPETLAPHDPRGALPPERRPDRRRGDAAPARRAGGERARVRRAHAVPRRARRRGALHRPPGPRPARPVVPAEAAVALGLPAARDQLRRMRRDRRARRLLGPGRRRRLPGARRRRAAPLARRARRDREAADRAARRRARRRACPSGPAATPSPSSRPPTRSTEGFACGRSPHDPPRPGRRVRARRRQGARRPRRGAPLPLRRELLGRRAAVRRAGAPGPRTPRASSASTRASARSASAGRTATASRSRTWRTSTS